MSEVRQLPGVDKRVETGAVQFGDDWPGYFIRGDQALHIVMCIGYIEKFVELDDKIKQMYFGYLTSMRDDICENVLVTGPENPTKEEDQPNDDQVQ